jgi:hypothetical protein
MYSIPNLPDRLTREIYAELCKSLPSPATATPEARASRDARAMTAVAHYLPENAAEAELAAQIVAADFHAKDALRAVVAALAVPDAPEARRSRAQAALMMRQMHAGVRTLQRMQAERVKAEAAMRPAAMERAGYWFRAKHRISVGLPEVGQTKPIPKPKAERGGRSHRGRQCVTKEPRLRPGPVGRPSPPRSCSSTWGISPRATCKSGRRVLGRRDVPAELPVVPWLGATGHCHVPATRPVPDVCTYVSKMAAAKSTKHPPVVGGPLCFTASTDARTAYNGENMPRCAICGCPATVRR